MAHNDWGVFCSSGTEYEDKFAWVESLCNMSGAHSYDMTSETVTWFQMLLDGLKWHFVVFFGAVILAFALGSLLGVMRTSSNKWLLRVSGFYIEVFRNVPLIIQYFFWLLIFPECLPGTFSQDSNAVVNGLWYKKIAATHPWLIGILGLGLYHAARIAENIRAGIQAIPVGQWHASFALGLSSLQAYANTILPVAYRTVWPTLTSEMMNMFKNASVAFAVSVLNFYAQTKSMIELTSQDTVILIVTTLVYLWFTYTIKVVMAIFERRLRIPGTLATGGH
ncbi:amino acid ABC transporter permease [Hydromonas duriensis]|uniref:Amino acid ABC transporter membrane protein 1 (PAAT family) n=1 Tax=Hydromonas duriensis TaxID=1527608 RepID=A0A4R6Y109_9BURK|nr:amino acid ABC transporter permease [Hydromonas duriensis]TDR29022.1 amino acid ABC transporter membrane protein 1 (PAAT family) [Hydromonas duriensis]